jgi:acyl-CoA synthetase (AMP-forming)/AMP-acid ligase II
VPTVWLMLMQHMQKNNLKLSTLQMVGIGGSACPPAMIRAFEDDYGVEVRHAWGMTEMSPVGSTGAIKPIAANRPHEEILALKAKQGWAPFAVVKSYFKAEGGEILDENGFFDTGDVATIDPNGYMQITDRAKDVIKSGGEWISSIEIENIAVGHPEVAEAAVIGVVHPKWDERPLLIIVPKEGKTPERDSVLNYLNGRIAKWWMPDDVQLVQEIPHTATGKINKLKLREAFANYRLPTA